MEIELMVQIGILGCLVYIIWFLRAFDEVIPAFFYVDDEISMVCRYI